MIKNSLKHYKFLGFIYLINYTSNIYVLQDQINMRELYNLILKLIFLLIYMYMWQLIAIRLNIQIDG